MYVQGVRCERKIPYCTASVMVCTKVCVYCYAMHLNRKNKFKTTDKNEDVK